MESDMFMTFKMKYENDLKRPAEFFRRLLRVFYGNFTEPEGGYTNGQKVLHGVVLYFTAIYGRADSWKKKLLLY